jgi:hypothetical protein
MEGDVTSMWFLMAWAVLGAVVVIAFKSWQRRVHTPDLGGVSTQWIAEHRAGSGYDSQR